MMGQCSRTAQSVFCTHKHTHTHIHAHTCRIRQTWRGYITAHNAERQKWTFVYSFSDVWPPHKHKHIHSENCWLACQIAFSENLAILLISKKSNVKYLPLDIFKIFVWVNFMTCMIEQCRHRPAQWPLPPPIFWAGRPGSNGQAGGRGQQNCQENIPSKIP